MNALLKYALAIAGCALVLFGAYSHGVTVTTQHFAASEAIDRANAEAEERSKERDIQQRLETVQVQGAQELDQVRIAARGADTELGRLRQRIADLQIRASCSDSTAASGSEAARRAAMVLSELLDRNTTRLGEISAAYDTARVRGLSCEAAYEVLRTQ